MLYDDEIFKHASVAIGSVINRATGRPMRLRVLIQRRWGWTRTAAEIAAEDMRARNVGILSLQSDARLWQQMALFERLPHLLPALLEGLARGRATRDDFHASMSVAEVTVRLLRPVQNLGMVSDIVDAVVQRLGEDARGHIQIAAHDDDKITIHVGEHDG